VTLSAASQGTATTTADDRAMDVGTGDRTTLRHRAMLKPAHLRAVSSPADTQS